MTSVVIVDGGGNILEYVAGDEEAQQVRYQTRTTQVLKKEDELKYRINLHLK